MESPRRAAWLLASLACLVACEAGEGRAVRQTAQDYVEALERGDHHSAYALLSQQDRAEISEDRYVSMGQELSANREPDASPIKLRVTQVLVEDDHAEVVVRGRLPSPQLAGGEPQEAGQQHFTIYALRREQGQWRIAQSRLDRKAQATLAELLEKYRARAKGSDKTAIDLMREDLDKALEQLQALNQPAGDGEPCCPCAKDKPKPKKPSAAALDAGTAKEGAADGMDAGAVEQRDAGAAKERDGGSAEATDQNAASKAGSGSQEP